MINPRKILNLDDRNLAALLTAIFLVLAGILMMRHEMWRDELQAWLIAKNSTSLWNLFHNLKYEGHPPFWYLLLRPLALIFGQPQFMQALHLLMAAAAVYIFVRWAPFPGWIRCLFPFGYFPFYEYAIISRNYTVGTLMLFTVCRLFKDRWKKSWWLIFSLLLLAISQVLFAVVALFIGLGWFLEYLLEYKKFPGNYRFYRNIGFLVFFIGLIIIFINLIPPADSWYKDYGLLAKKIDLPQITRSSWYFMESFMTVPSLKIKFWNSNIIRIFPRTWEIIFSVSLTIFIFLWMILFFLNKPPALFIYLAGTLAVLIFQVEEYWGGVRHKGVFLYILLASLWLSGYILEIKLPRFLDFLNRLSRRYFYAFLTIILLIQMAAAGVAFYYDYRYQFSTAPAAKAFLQKTFSGRDFLLVSELHFCPYSLGGYLDKAFYFPSTGSSETFCVQKFPAGKLKAENLRQLFDRAERLSGNRHLPAVVALEKKVGIDGDYFSGITQKSKSLISDLIQRGYLKIIGNKNSPLYFYYPTAKFDGLKNYFQLTLGPEFMPRRPEIYYLLKNHDKIIFRDLGIIKFAGFDNNFIARGEEMYLYLIKPPYEYSQP